jgi:hypothetical protein
LPEIPPNDKYGNCADSKTILNGEYPGLLGTLAVLLNQTSHVISVDWLNVVDAELPGVPAKVTIPPLTALNVAALNARLGVLPIKSLHPLPMVVSDFLLPASMYKDILPVTNLGPAFVAILLSFLEIVEV